MGRWETWVREWRVWVIIWPADLRALNEYLYPGESCDTHADAVPLFGQGSSAWRIGTHNAGQKYRDSREPILSPCTNSQRKCRREKSLSTYFQIFKNYCLRRVHTALHTNRRSRIVVTNPSINRPTRNSPPSNIYIIRSGAPPPN